MGCTCCTDRAWAHNGHWVACRSGLLSKFVRIAQGDRGHVAKSYWPMSWLYNLAGRGQKARLQNTMWRMLCIYWRFDRCEVCSWQPDWCIQHAFHFSVQIQSSFTYDFNGQGHPLCASRVSHFWSPFWTPILGSDVSRMFKLCEPTYTAGTNLTFVQIAQLM